MKCSIFWFFVIFLGVKQSSSLSWTAESGQWITEGEHTYAMADNSDKPRIIISPPDVVVGGSFEAGMSFSKVPQTGSAGFVIGFQPGDLLNSEAEYLLLDWHAFSLHRNSDCPAQLRVDSPGLTLNRVSGSLSSTSLAFRMDGRMADMDCAQKPERVVGIQNANVGIWEPGQEYRFRFEASPEVSALERVSIKVYMNDQELFRTTSTAGGRWGFFVKNQEGVLFRPLGLTRDNCPFDRFKTEPGICGCGVSDVDTDQDGTSNCLDECWRDPAKIDAGICGCGVPDTDTDGDETADCIDQCPLDPNKIYSGNCGCGFPDAPEERGECDRCPYDPDKTAPGVCGCGIPDTDIEGDGIVDCLRQQNVVNLNFTHILSLNAQTKRF